MLEGLVANGTITEAKAAPYALALLETIRLAKKDEYPSRLSVGQLQRGGIARALAHKVADRVSFSAEYFIANTRSEVSLFQYLLAFF